MTQKRNNYALQVEQAKKRFLTYDQQELIDRCRLRFDENHLYTTLLSEDYRICRKTGNFQRLHRGCWIDGNGFNEVMTILDWLCDSRADRYITGRWINVITHGHYFHGNLQENSSDSYARYFDRNPEAFSAACLSLKGERFPGADVSYAIELLDGLRILVQLWHGDEEFPPRLRCLWDENTTRFIRYETTWYALELLMERLGENLSHTSGGEI